MKTILAVDDDKWVLEVMRDALGIRGYEVLTAESGAQAVRVLQERPVDLVPLDLNMPGKNGFSVLHEMYSSTRVPVLFVSGCSRSFSPTSDGFTNVWENDFADGMTDILYKPFPLSLLYEKIECLIGENEPVVHGQAR